MANKMDFKEQLNQLHSRVMKMQDKLSELIEHETQWTELFKDLKERPLIEELEINILNKSVHRTFKKDFLRSLESLPLPHQKNFILASIQRSKKSMKKSLFTLLKRSMDSSVSGMTILS